MIVDQATNLFGIEGVKLDWLQLAGLGPVLILTAVVLALIVGDALFRRFLRRPGLGLSLSAGLSLLGAVGSMAIAAVTLWINQSGAGEPIKMFIARGAPGSFDPLALNVHPAMVVRAWQGAGIVADHLALVTAVFACSLLALACILLWSYMRTRPGVYKAEVFPLLVSSAIGIVLLGMSRDLIITFIAIEILSLPLYVLCGMDEARETSRESSLKYFLLGAFASGFFIYGAALVYGVAGHLNYSAIHNYFFHTADVNIVGILGVALVGAGIAFKLALVPFHAWLPDVYQGAPAPVTAFMASGVKLGVVVAALRFIAEALPSLSRDAWVPALAYFALASMVFGNLFALHQRSVKRLLGYSAITHTGYIALGLCVGKMTAAPGILVYLAGYYLASFGAFALISYLAPAAEDDVYLDDLHELATRAPGTAATLVILLMSMMGLPLTLGFMGKLMVFSDAWLAGLRWLVIAAVLNSVVSAYFYLRIILAMYMQPKVPGQAEIALPRMRRGFVVAGAVTAALTLLFGVLPDLLILFSTAKLKIDLF